MRDDGPKSTAGAALASRTGVAAAVVVFAQAVSVGSMRLTNARE